MARRPQRAPTETSALPSRLPRDQLTSGQMGVASILVLDTDTGDWLDPLALGPSDRAPSPGVKLPGPSALEEFEAEHLESDLAPGLAPEAITPAPQPIDCLSERPTGMRSGAIAETMAETISFARKATAVREPRFSANIVTAAVTFAVVALGLVATAILLVSRRESPQSRPQLVARAFSTDLQAAVPTVLPTALPSALVLPVATAPEAEVTPASAIQVATTGTPPRPRDVAASEQSRAPVALTGFTPPAVSAAAVVVPPPLPPVRTLAGVPAIGIAAPPDSRPSVSAASPVRSEPSAAPAETAQARETRAIQAVLGRYQAAFNDLNASIAKSIWPSLDERKLEKAFDQLEQQEVVFDGCQIEVSDGRAVASCQGRARYVRKVGRHAERTEPRNWNFILRNAPEGWMIATVQTR